MVFHCLDDMDPDTPYYESVDLHEARHPQTLLAHSLNDQPLPVPNGAPLRLRVGRQLGYKQAKYIEPHRTGRIVRPHRRRQRRLLGRPGLRVVRRHLTPRARG